MASPLGFNLTDNELNSISKSYELFRIIMHKKIPMKEKLFTATKLLKDANVNFPNKYLEQNTPLHVAVARGYIEIVELLMKFNADVNAKNEDGETPLHVAVARGAVSIAELLVKGGADATLVNDAGETALDEAKENQQVIVAVLSNIRQTPTQECNKHRQEVNDGKNPNQDLGLPSANVDAFSTLPRAHAASGAKFSLHGTVYQLKLLMLFLVRALRQGYPFRLATEMDEAEKFDDLVFQYQIGQDIKSLYLQAKHKQNAAKGMISMADLLSVAKTDQFSLHKYFMSYFKIKQRIGLKADEIDYVICTNTNFDFKEPCKLTNDSSVFCFQEVDKFSQDYMEYFKEGKCYRLIFDDTTLKLLCEKFADAEENLGTISEDYKNSVRIFFSKLVFAVGQPNELKLDEIIKTEFEFNDHINLLNTEFVANSLMKLMLDWFKAKEGTFFSNLDATNFMDAMKQKINHLKSAGINSEYPEMLQTFGISFNDNTLNELHKVISEHKIIHLITPKETMLTGIKVVGMLKYSGNYRKDDSYVFVRLSTLLLRETQEIVIGAFKSSGSHDLLVIDCSSDNGTMLLLFRRLLEILQDKDNTQKKIILIAQENHPLLQMFKTVPQYYEQKVVNKFQDFTPESQVILLSTPVVYQGQRVELRQIVNETETDLLEVIPLDDLIKKDPIDIGAKLPVSNGYNKAFYINRTLKYQIAIKLYDFLMDGNSSDTEMVYTEGEFDQCCKEYPDKNIHMLKKEEFGYTWIQTHGSLVHLRRFIDSSYSQCFTEEQVLSIVEGQRVVIISDSAGMGKSTVLTHISKLIKGKHPACFVFRIDLNNFTDDLEKTRVVQFDNSSAINFVCDRMIMIQTPLECALFKRRGKVVLLFDGFDEISPDYNDTVINLIRNLREATQAQIWIATRPFMREELEDALQQFSYTLETFSEYNQLNFLTEFWKYALQVNASEHQIIIFAKSLIKRLSESISDKERALTGIPLQIRILAECFIEDMKDFLNSGLSEPVLDECFKLVDLYKRFISKKFEVYLTEKAGVLESNPTVKSFQKILLETHMKNHELLALLAVLSVEKVALLEPIYKNPIDSDDTLTDLHKIGIINIVNGKPRFLHYTFAEYLVAVYLIRVLIQERQREVQEFILTDILLGDKYKMVRAFINELLVTSQPNIKQLNAYGNLMVVLCENNKNDKKNNILHQAAEEDNHEILAFLCNCMKTHSHMLQELLLNTNSDGHNVPQVAARHNRIVLIGNLLKWMQGTLCQGNQEMLMSFLLATNENGSTLHVAATYNQTSFTEAYFQWVQDNMSPDQGLALLDTLLQTTDKYAGYTLLHEAVRQGNTALIETLLVWTKAHLSHSRLKSMILSTNTWKTTLLHVTAHYGYVTVAETLLNWIRDNVDDGRTLLTTLLVAADGYAETVLHKAIRHSHEDLAAALLQWVHDNTDRSVMVTLLLATDEDGNSVLHESARWSRVQLMETLLRWTCDYTDTDALHRHLAARNINGRTAMEEASIKGYEIAVEKLRSFDVQTGM